MVIRNVVIIQKTLFKTMTFTTEVEFENVFIEILTQKGWETEIIKYPTEESLLENWAKILFWKKFCFES